MNWGKIFMDGIIAAIIGVAGVILAGFITELFIGKRVGKQIELHSGNSKDDHKEIKGSIDKSAAIITESIGANATATVSEIKSLLENKEKLDEKNYQALSKDQARIADSVKDVQLLPTELARLNNDNKMLLQQVEHLQKEKEQIVSENTHLKTENTRLETENKHLLDKAARLEERAQHKFRSDYTQEL